MRYHIYGQQRSTKITNKLLSVLAVASLLFSSASSLPLLFTQRALAVTNTETVYQNDFANSWTTWTYHDDRKDSTDPLNAATPAPNTNHQIAANPNPAPGNNGAVKLTASGGQKFNLASLQYSGTKLKDITSLGFDVYTDNPGQAYINLDINFNSWQHGPGTVDHQRLVYVPQGVIANQWSSHEATTQGLWSWSGGDTWPDGVEGPRTWSSIVDAFPNAYISRTLAEIVFIKKPFGSLYLRADGDSPVTAYFDNIYLTTATQNTKYNFELSPAPAGLGFVDGAQTCGGVTSTNFAQPKWDSVSGAVSYDYQAFLNGNLVFAANYSSTHPGGTFGGGQNGEWSFRVRAVNADGTVTAWSEPCAINLDTSAPTWDSNPVHESPLNGASVTEGSNILMQWTDASDPNGVNYYYEVSYSNQTNGPGGSFVNPIWTFGPLTSSEHDGTGTVAGNYFWHVKACDDLGNCTPWTDPWGGSVVAEQINQPNSPATGGGNTLGATTGGNTLVVTSGRSGAVQGIGGNNQGFNQTNNLGDGDNQDQEDDAGEVEGANVENDFASIPATLAAADINEQSGCTKIFGLCWYYWPPIIVAVLTLGYIIYRKTQTEN